MSALVLAQPGARASVTVTFVSVTLPVFSTVMVKFAVPPPRNVCEAGSLVMLIAGFCSAGVVSSSQASAAPSAPSSTQASLRKLPASMSACVIVWLAVHVIDAPGANGEPLAGVQTRLRTFGSVTVTAASVVLPAVRRHDRVIDHVTDRA